MPSELLPCPFKHSVKQGSLASDYEPYSTDSLSEDSNWCVCCPVCKSATGYYNTEEQARHAWNYRTPPPSEAPQPPTWWCCSADYPNHDATCTSAVAQPVDTRLWATALVDTWIDEWAKGHAARAELIERISAALTVARTSQTQHTDLLERPQV